MKIVSLMSSAGLVLACAVSPARAVPVSGNIAVYNGVNLLGYVSTVFDSQRSYTYTATVANALAVQFDTGSTPFAILATNGPDAAHPYFGAVGGSVSYQFGPGSPGYAYLAGTGLTPSGSTPSVTAGTSIQSLGYNGPAESTIWSLTGNVLNAQWVNVNGTVVPATTFFDPIVNFVGIVGDLAAFNTSFPGENAIAVTLRFTALLPTAVPEPSSVVLLGLGLVALATIRRNRRR